MSSTAAINTGTSSVMMRNDFDRTRSKYSRFATTIILLAMSGQPRFDAGGADTLEEDLMQRGLHELEALDARARVDEPAQQDLRVRVRRELDLEIVVVVVELRHELRVAQHGADAVLRADG